MTGMGSSGRRQLPATFRPAVFAETKFLPARPQATLVERTALVQRLIGADDLPLTVVIGSPGSGKSWLLGEWYRHATARGSATWLSADRGDADPIRFWRGFIAAVQRIVPEFGVAAADAMTLDRAVSADALESLLVDDGALDRRVHLVIDDFHLVAADAVEQLRHLLERGLRNVRVLIGSRTEPCIGVQRLRLRREVCEIRDGHLRLDVGETARLLAALGVDPLTIDVGAVQRRTEGWLAGIQMAALAAVGADDPARRISEVLSGGRLLADYLAAEVLASQSAPVRRFLEDTCVVDELDNDLVRTLTDGGDGEVVTLQQVEDANLLIDRLDTSGSVYRYHHLFAETLRSRLAAHDPDRFRAQHLRAAEVLVARGAATEAIRHFWFAERRDQAARLIRGNMASVLLAPGAPPPVEEIELSLGRDELASAPGDAVGYALALLMNGRPADANALLDLVDSLGAEQFAASDRQHLLCARTGSLMLLGDAGAAERTMAAVVAMVRSGEGAPDALTKVALPQGIRAAAWEGSFDRADDFDDVLSALQAGTSDPVFDRVEAVGARAFLCFERGRVDETIRLARAAESAAHELDVVGNGPSTAVCAVLAAALLEQGHLDEAAAFVDEAIGAGRAERIPSLTLASIVRARLFRADGHFDAALATIEAARSRVGRAGPAVTLGDRLDQVEIAVRLGLGDLTRASLLADGMQPGRLGQLMRGWVDLAGGRLSVAASIAASLRDSAATPRQELDALLLSARLAAEREAPELDELAGRLLDLAESTGAVLPLAEAGTAVLQAVVRASRTRPRSQVIDRLLATRPMPRPADQARPEYRVEELSARELIVLQYMATSLSNQEIARELYLSVNTVKTHVKHVLRKLRATSRVEAVERAQALHYL
jgi:LuxR family maltose regulon positive regulatory protein